MTSPQVKVKRFRFSLKVMMVLFIIVAMICALTSIYATLAAIFSCLAIVAYLALEETKPSRNNK